MCITVNPKGNEPCIFTGRTDAEAQAPILWPLDANSWLTGKDPDAGKGWRQKKRATEDEMVGWHHRYVHGHELGQTLGEGEGQGKPGGLPCMGLQRSQTWLGNWTTIKKYTYRHTLEWRLKYILIMYSEVITPFLLSGKQWNSKKKLLRKLTKRNKWLKTYTVYCYRSACWPKKRNGVGNTICPSEETKTSCIEAGEQRTGQDQRQQVQGTRGWAAGYNRWGTRRQKGR